MHSRPSARHLGALRRWQRMRNSQQESSSPFAAVYFTSGRVFSTGFTRLADVRAIVLQACRDTVTMQPSLTCSMYGARPCPNGIHWGGEQNHLFEKDLGLRPRWHAHGARLDLQYRRTLHSILDVWESLQRVHVDQVSDMLTLPTAWAAFDRGTEIAGDGPEFWGMASELGMSSVELMARYQWEDENHTFAPLNWVSDQWQQIAEIYLDLTIAPNVQVLDNRIPDRTLVGHRGAAMFDFLDRRDFSSVGQSQTARRKRARDWANGSHRLNIVSATGP